MPDNHVSTRLREFLVTEDLGRSRRLPPERELADELVVSRPALREAFRRLEELEVIEVRRGVGAYLSLPTFGDVLEVRRMLEPSAARLAADRRDPQHMLELRAAFERLVQATDDQETFGDADESLHHLVARSSGNPTLARTLRALAEVVSYMRRSTVADSDMREATKKDWHAIIAAIDRQQGTAAAAAMDRHLDHTGEAFARESGEQR